MKINKAADLQIAREVMNLPGIDKDSVLPYTTSIDAAYHVVNRFQNLGWRCNIQSRINDKGELFYLMRFQKNEIVIERFAPTLPLAICSAGLSIVKNQQGTDSSGSTDESDIEISGVKGHRTATAINADDETILVLIKNVIENSGNPIPNPGDFAINILNELHSKHFIIIKDITEEI